MFPITETRQLDNGRVENVQQIETRNITAEVPRILITGHNNPATPQQRDLRF